MNSSRHAAKADHPRRWSAQSYRLRPTNWGISTRSAIVCASVVLVAVLVSGAGLLFVLNRSLLSSVDVMGLPALTVSHGAGLTMRFVVTGRCDRRFRFA